MNAPSTRTRRAVAAVAVAITMSGVAAAAAVTTASEDETVPALPTPENLPAAVVLSESAEIDPGSAAVIRCFNRTPDIVATGSDSYLIDIWEDEWTVEDQLTGALIASGQTPADEIVVVTGSGNDSVDAAAEVALVACTGAGNDQVDGSDQDDLISTGLGDDAVDGDDGNDVIHLGPGDDVVDGSRGADEIVSGSGADVVYGGRGFDACDRTHGAEPGVDDVHEECENLVADVPRDGIDPGPLR